MTRIAAVIVGWLFVLAGLVGLFLPFLQGIVFLLIGLMILSKEYRWAGRLLARVRARFPPVDRWLQRAENRAMVILRRLIRKTP
jgi:uncharacterized membrane protein YbaN (DUF454 family)